MQTFRERVAAFWEWFPAIAANLSEVLENAESAEMATTMVSQKMKQLLPSLSWVMGKEPETRSFTVTGEGQVAKQLLAEFWLSQAPEVDNWQFFASRQPSSADSVRNMAIGLGEQQEVDAEGFIIKTQVDEERQRIDIVVWHPKYAKIGEEHHMPMLFIFLDEALGEFGTQTKLGAIDVEPLTAGDDTRTLYDLPAFIESVHSYHEWESVPPLESLTLYKNPNTTDSPRGDTLFGSTCIPYIVFEYCENGELTENPLGGTGAEFAYVAIDASVFPDGEQVDVRANIEDTLDEALRKESSGRTLGGAFGLKNSYIEFLTFDGENSLSIVKKVLADLQLSDKSSIESF